MSNPHNLGNFAPEIQVVCLDINLRCFKTFLDAPELNMVHDLWPAP